MKVLLYTKNNPDPGLTAIMEMYRYCRIFRISPKDYNETDIETINNMLQADTVYREWEEEKRKMETTVTKKPRRR